MNCIVLLVPLILLVGCSREPQALPATTRQTGAAAGEIPSPPEHTGRGTVAERIAYYGPAAHSRLTPIFQRAGVAYPPQRLVLLALKAERILELYAAGADGRLAYVSTYPVLAASGVSGPKLREGDRQVPEGIYEIESLNPNSSYHLSLRVNYPNAFDREMARKDGRTNLGGDIMIHGKAGSVGCLAMGDRAAEDLFVLAADTGLARITLLIAPVDFRRNATADLPAASPWTATLYANLREQVARIPLPAQRE